MILSSKAAEYPKGSILFVEGETAAGVYQLASGRVKLSVVSPQGRTVIVRIASPGELVGLPGTLNGRYAASAEALDRLRASFIPRQHYLGLLQGQSEDSLQAAQAVSAICKALYQATRRLGLPARARARFAGFLLGRLAPPGGNGERRGAMELTHEQIGQLLGLSRETVSRLFGEFKRAGWIEAAGGGVALVDTAELRKLAAT